ncbi:MAG: DUF4330 domain-containing protein [Firmicutes bacterium]|nr:DUF4330 domain-containing protein [Bacillota bacterium]
MSNKKPFGKFNVIDLAVVIAILIIAAGVYVRFFGSPTKTVVQSTDFFYTFEVKSIRESNLIGLEKSINGKIYLNEKITSDMGTLLKVESKPAVDLLETADGKQVLVNIPERFDAVLTIKLNGRINESGFFTPTLKHISAGIEYNIKSKWSAVFGKVLRVRQEDAA